MCKCKLYLKVYLLMRGRRRRKHVFLFLSFNLAKCSLTWQVIAMQTVKKKFYTNNLIFYVFLIILKYYFPSGDNPLGIVWWPVFSFIFCVDLFKSLLWPGNKNFNTFVKHLQLLLWLFILFESSGITVYKVEIHTRSTSLFIFQMSVCFVFIWEQPININFLSKVLPQEQKIKCTLLAYIPII